MLEIAVRRTALLLLDFENYSVHPDGYWAQQDPAAAVRGGRAMANARRALTAAREVGMTVVHIGQQWRKGYPELNVRARGKPVRSRLAARSQARGPRRSATRWRRSPVSS